MEGRETELDKTVIEAIKDPLTRTRKERVNAQGELKRRGAEKSAGEGEEASKR